MLIKIQSLVNTLLPYSFGLYIVSLVTSMSGMEMFSWLTVFFFLVDLAIACIKKEKRPNFKRIGGDIWLGVLVIVVATGLLINAPDAPFMKYFGIMRWVPLLYFLVAIANRQFPIERYFKVLLVSAGVVALYGVVQHFTGFDFRWEWGLRGSEALRSDAVKGMPFYQVIGLFGHHLTYGYSFSMILCLCVAGSLLLKSKPKYRKILVAMTVIVGASVLMTYGRGVWLASAVSMVAMSYLVSRKVFYGVIACGVLAFATLYTTQPTFKKRVDKSFEPERRSNRDRTNLWQANIQMFKEHPIVGIGYMQNEKRTLEYYEKLGISNKFRGHAHNNYLQFLSTTGVLGLSAYLIFIVSFLMMTHHLYLRIPPNHEFHRAIVLGSYGAQISLHVGGLTQWTFGDAEVNHLFIFILAATAAIHRHYIDTHSPPSTNKA